MLTEANIEG